VAAQLDKSDPAGARAAADGDICGIKINPQIIQTTSSPRTLNLCIDLSGVFAIKILAIRRRHC
jgi:hypothetical protein